MKLCEVLKQYRWAMKIGLRGMAAEIGVSASTLSRIEGGEIPNGGTLSRILCWLLKEDDHQKNNEVVQAPSPPDSGETTEETHGR